MNFPIEIDSIATVEIEKKAGEKWFFRALVSTSDIDLVGDIVTDLASVLQGGMGMAVGANIGSEHGMFEPIHGSAPKYAGKDKVNPIAMILSVKEGLDWLGTRQSNPNLGKAAAAIEAAVIRVLEAGEPLTYDLVGNERAAPCSVVGKAIAAEAASILAG